MSKPSSIETIAPRTIGLMEARALAEICLGMADSDGGKPVSITVADAFGESLVVLRQDGASLDSMNISQAKARVAARGKKDTVEILFQRTEECQEWHPRSDKEIRQAEAAAASRRAAGHATYVTWAGGHCVLSYGDTIGAVGVSGRDQLEDHNLAWRATIRWQFGFMEAGDRVRVESNHGARRAGKDVGEYISLEGSVVDVNNDFEGDVLCVVQLDDGPEIQAWGSDLKHL